MKPKCPSSGQRNAGSLSMELVVAISVLTIAVIPFAYSFLGEQRLLRHAYHHAAAMELVDGEAEILAAGGLNRFAEGETAYPLTAGAATNLPPGRFRLHRQGSAGVLEWRPEKPVPGGNVRREFRLLSAGGAQ